MHETSLPYSLVSSIMIGEDVEVGKEEVEDVERP